MKDGIHPKFNTIKAVCACGNEVELGSTLNEIRVEICSACHPFFTGKQKLVDTAGRLAIDQQMMDEIAQLHAQLKPLVIRRRKEDVLRDLPQELVNNYYLDLHHQQQKIHSGYLQSLIPILNKKYLTPIDLRRIQELLVRMRMVCDSV